MMYHTVSTGHSSRRMRHAGLLFASLLLLGLACAPRPARADCGFLTGSATTVTFNAGTVTLNANTPIGTVLWTSAEASPANPPYLVCNGTTNSGIFNTIAGPPTIGNDTFPTGIPGISYRLLHPDTSKKLKQYPNYPVDSAEFSIGTTLQLVYTGPDLPSNNSVLSGQLAQWKVDICDNPQISYFWPWGYSYLGCNGSVAPRTVQTFNIAADIIIQVPTCNIDPLSVNKSVSLPWVNSQQFTGPGSTAGKTHFSLQLTQCHPGLNVYITLDTANPQPDGVISPTTGPGYATGVGVQILKADGTTPIVFKTPFYTGVTTANDYAINLYARYYQTAANISSGDVSATATYTITYQ